MDVRKNINLTDLRLHNNKICEIDIFNNINLTILFLGDNKLSVVDSRKNSNLAQFDLSNNNLKLAFLTIANTKSTEEYLFNFHFSHQLSPACEIILKYSQDKFKCNQLK